ncbi:MAG: serine hydrolase, partial [bacterium]|nr:serine hydrolase [bacterium]
NYQVLPKEENHFSSIGQVWMPWSMQFFGNFFIHGWPYDERGQPVPEGYSGGCIRLSTNDAEAVYNFATRQTLISIYGANITTPTADQTYYLDTSDRPQVSASSYVVADLETGDLIMAKNDEVVRPIASVSKLLTALTSLDVVNQYQVAIIGLAAVGTYGTQGNLTAGEKMPVKELIFPMLLESSNDAAEALAEHFGRANFINQINNKAAAIGLTKTNFSDPSGLSPQNVSTARDLARLAKHIYQYKRYIFAVTKERQYVYGEHTWLNSNKLLGTTGYLGGKNGFTDEASQTGVALFNLPLAEFAERPVVLVLLKSADRDKDMSTLINFIKKHAVFGEQPKNPTFQYL